MAQFPSTTSASDVWNVTDIYRAVAGGNWPSPLAPDPYFPYVTMLLPGDGTNGAQNNTFLDSSTNNFTITRNGNTTQGSFSPYGSNWSNSFATSAGVQFPYTSSLTSWWTQNFTMEMWIFNNTNAVSGTNSLPLQFAHGVYTTSSTYWSFGTNASGQVNFYYFNGGQNNVTSTATASLATWNHIAMVYTHSTGNISLYLNGVSVASATKSGTPQNSNTNTVNIGAVQGTYYNGYISNLRVLNGTALYTTTFTPSTTPLTAITNTQLLTCQSNRFVDNSTNNATPTIIGTPSVQRFNPFGTSTAYSTATIGGSGYFDGSGDYLRAPTGYLPSIGTGSFTVEGWWNFGDFTTRTLYFQRLWSFGTGLANDVTLNVDNSGNLIFRINDSIIAPQSSGAMKLNSWNHVALVRSGSTVTIYLNGTSVASASNSSNLTTQSTSPFYIGSESDGAGGYFYGYCTNVRVTNTAVYTGAFTPPTTQLTAISGTGLLLSMTNAAIFDNAMMNDLETVGNAQISTSVVKYGTGSLKFDGTGDYLVSNTASSDLYAFGTGNFTIEFWLYLNSTSSVQVFYDGRPASSQGLQPTIYTDSSGTLFYYTNAANRITGSSLSANIWYHIAVARSGTSTKMFVGGTQVGSTYTDSTNYVNPALRPMIGADGFNSGTPGGNAMNGYIDDLRITKGYARYTANFTPPTAAFPTL